MANRCVALLTDRQAKLTKKTVAVGGVRGLSLRVDEKSNGIYSKHFQLRVVVLGKERKVSLGSYPEISLEEARVKALEWRKQMLSGDNPREHERALIREKLQKQQIEKVYSVRRMLVDFCEFGENRLWHNDTIKGQEVSGSHSDIVNGYIKNHLSKELLLMPARKLTPELLAEYFSEKWVSMIDTPERILGEMKRAFDYAQRSGKIPPMDNPADLKGRLRDLLPPDIEREQKGHHPALPPERIPELFAELSHHSGIGARLAEFCILTASRAANARLVVWDELFLTDGSHADAPIQITSRDEMKVKRVINFDRETPLSAQAVSVLQNIPRFNIESDHAFVFVRHTVKKGIVPVSNGIVASMFRKINLDMIHRGLEPFVDPNVIRDNVSATISLHGTARASFETWAYDSVRYNHKQFSETAIEHCLDHTTAKYNNAYLRRSVIGEMREIFEAWGNYCYSKR